jgi:hypothetical protein
LIWSRYASKAISGVVVQPGALEARPTQKVQVSLAGGHGAAVLVAQVGVDDVPVGGGHSQTWR